LWDRAFFGLSCRAKRFVSFCSFAPAVIDGDAGAVVGVEECRDGFLEQEDQPVEFYAEQLVEFLLQVGNLFGDAFAFDDGLARASLDVFSEQAKHAIHALIFSLSPSIS
jgi:hypothetical protein